MAETEIQFVGFAKEVIFASGGSVIKLSFKADDIAKLKEWQNEGGYTNIDLKKGRAGKWYMARDTWKPQPKDSGKISKQELSDDSSGLPF